MTVINLITSRHGTDQSNVILVKDARKEKPWEETATERNDQRNAIKKTVTITNDGILRKSEWFLPISGPHWKKRARLVLLFNRPAGHKVRTSRNLLIEGKPSIYICYVPMGAAVQNPAVHHFAGTNPAFVGVSSGGVLSSRIRTRIPFRLQILFRCITALPVVSKPISFHREAVLVNPKRPYSDQQSVHTVLRLFLLSRITIDVNRIITARCMQTDQSSSWGFLVNPKRPYPDEQSFHPVLRHFSHCPESSQSKWRELSGFIRKWNAFREQFHAKSQSLRSEGAKSGEEKGDENCQCHQYFSSRQGHELAKVN